MNDVMLALLGVPEILAILAIVLFWVGLIGGILFLVVWVIRRGQGPGRSQPQVSPQPEQPISTPSTCPRCGTPLPADSPQGLCPKCVMGVGLATQTEAGEFGPHGTKVIKPPPAPADIARNFPQLEILECLGRGGMGVVYKARQPKLNRHVALKILAPEKGADPKFAERFLREAQALARLSHPNIVTVHDFGEADGMFYLLMEYVDGATLRQLLREGRMKPEQALAIVPKICEALQFAHEQGIVHRDIKPENVLLDKQGRVKIADFGIAKMVVGAEHLTRPADTLSPSDGERAGVRGSGSLTQEQVLGTPHYMAPEQVEHPQVVDHRADIYSLGVVFYEMLTGELPLGKFQPPSKKVQVDVRLDEVVLHALEKEPDRRYQHVSEVKSDVETIASTPPPPDSGEAAVSSPAGETGNKQPWVSFCVALLYSGAFYIGLLSPLRSDRFLTGVFTLLTFVTPLLAFLLHKLTSPQAQAIWFKVAGWFALITSLPIIGFALFFFSALVRNHWKWNPSPGEAIVVPLFWSGAIALPICAINLWRAVKSQPPSAAALTAMTPSRFSRTAIYGALWVALFFINWGMSYTPPGWAVTAAFRHSFGILFDIVLFLPLTILGFAGLAGGSVLGVLALRQMRQARGRLRGFGLALFDVLFFPMVLLNWWGVWLAKRVISETGSTPSQLGVAVLIFIAVGLNALVIYAAWRRAKEFVKSPALPARPVVMGNWTQVIKATALRFMVVLAVQLAMVETLEQVSVHWKESDGEKWLMPIMVSGLAGLIWAFWPGYRLKRSPAYWAVGSMSFYLVLLLLLNFYTSILRPNLGLYREPDWVAKIPSFQKRLRARIEGNMWRKPDTTRAPQTSGTDIARRKFVRIVMDKDAMVFEGQPTAWEQIPAQLANVPDRANTVLELAIAANPITAEQEKYVNRCSELAATLGFEYSSFIGVHPPKSRGTPPIAKSENVPDQVLVEDLAARVLAAIRDNDVTDLQAAAAESANPGWRDALPKVANEIREEFTRLTGKPFAMEVGDKLIEDNRAAVKCNGPKELNGAYLALSFIKTRDGWLHCSMRISPKDTRLADHLPGPGLSHGK